MVRLIYTFISFIYFYLISFFLSYIFNNHDYEFGRYQTDALPFCSFALYKPVLRIKGPQELSRDHPPAINDICGLKEIQLLCIWTYWKRE